MMTTTGDSGSREELTTELATLDRQLRDLSNQWENVERTITEKVRLRRELIARQTESNEDHAGEIDRLQSDIYALRDRLDQLRDSHLDFSALYRILQQART
jgi:predicted RNase H-like nuclease (RuvC/YqgF family)